jgi:hypothetical protein
VTVKQCHEKTMSSDNINKGLDEREKSGFMRMGLDVV